MNVESKNRFLKQRVKSVTSAQFSALALDVFHYQAQYNTLYQQYLQLINCKQDQVYRLQDIPFLPIELFKSHFIQTAQWTPALTFTSSGTTGSQTSRHALRDGQFYKKNARRAFEEQYGSLENYCVLALLPAYLERQGSSLVYMAADFIEVSKSKNSGFFLNNIPELLTRIERANKAGEQILLLGVSFALLDLAEQQAPDLSNVIIMETGGMKGRRKEMTREELHGFLTQKFNVQAIHSEYGMTELLSQAYSQGQGVFTPSPTMEILIREPTDPAAYQAMGKAGVINVIDLANLDTISFIATQDLGLKLTDNTFKILGRLDNSDIRGCNLMIQ